MRVNKSFGSFDRSWELHESRRELQKQAISKSLPIRRRRKKENIISYVSSTSDGWSNDSDCQQFDKRQNTKKKKRGSNEQKQGNRKKKKDSRHLSCNSHYSFDRAMRVEETLMQILAANSHQLSFVNVKKHS